MKKILNLPFFIRLLHWEYWNSTFVYFVLYPYWIWLSWRARSWYFLVAANPGIKYGGYIMESKWEVYQSMDRSVYPATLYIEPHSDASLIRETIRSGKLSFPLICKPDIGERGLGVKKVNDEQELAGYAAKMTAPYLVQEWVDYRNEVGIFYCRHPNEDFGMITGIVNKETVSVTGDGVSTLRQLVFQNERYILQWKHISKTHSDILDQVLERDEQLVLVPYGNHVRGSKFTDVSHRISKKLTDVIHRVSSAIPGFYYGRLDIKFASWEQLEDGQAFSVIEVNGSGSEPTHIYDPRHSLFFAWREISRHWKILYSICEYNHLHDGVPYLKLKEGQQLGKAFRKMESELKQLS